MEAETIERESSAQSAFAKETNAFAEAKRKYIANKSESKAKPDDYLVQSQTELAYLVTNLDELSAYDSELQACCDFILNGFELLIEEIISLLFFEIPSYFILNFIPYF